LTKEPLTNNIVAYILKTCQEICLFFVALNIELFKLDNITVYINGSTGDKEYK